jgi:hypothetical protein
VKHPIRPLLLAATFAAAVPLTVAAAPAPTTSAGPACEDAVARAIHQAEEATHLHALHAVEEAYCTVRP